MHRTKPGSLFDHRGGPADGWLSDYTIDNFGSLRVFDMGRKLLGTQPIKPGDQVAVVAKRFSLTVSTQIEWLQFHRRLSSNRARSRRQGGLLDHLVGAGEQGGGTARPSALAVLTLMTISSFVENSIGRSPGFAPCWLPPQAWSYRARGRRRRLGSRTVPGSRRLD